MPRRMQHHLPNDERCCMKYILSAESREVDIPESAED